MSEKAISIIIPVFNCKKYFKQCIDSVRNQSLKNIEIIVIDDCSTDEDYCKAVAQLQDDRFKFIQNKTPLGSGVSRNRGLECATGTFVAFLDADDFYPDPESLRILYEIAIRENLNICGGSLFIIDSKSEITNKTFPGQYFLHDGKIKYKDYQHDGGFYRFIYKRNFLLQHHLAFPAFKRMQDPVFFVKSMLAAEHFYAVDMYVYAYRKNHKKLLWDEQKTLDHYFAIKEILSISDENNLAHLHYLMTKNFYHFSIKNLHHIKGIKKRLRIVRSIIQSINFKLLKKKWPEDTESFNLLKLIPIYLLSFTR